MRPQAPMPRWLWWIPVGIAALRSLPWLASRFAAPESPDEVFLEMGFLPKDTLQYLAFARQTGETGSWLLLNPFTTEPQAGHFLLPLLSSVGWLSAMTGVAPIAWFEAARLPLLLAYFWLLWRLLEPFFPDPGERALTCSLIGLSGGLEVLAKPLAAGLPTPQMQALEQATWQMSGWSLFAASANPLWIAGGAGALALLRPLLTPTARLSGPAMLAVAAGLFGLYVLHPYSAVAVLGIAAAQPAVALAARAEVDWRRWLPIGLALTAGALSILALASWQRTDPVFAQSALGALGEQQLSPFWYPLVLGALCILALRGARVWVAGDHPLRFALLAWLLAAVFLHTSTLLNGYHFASQLHVPLCILAAPAFFETWRAARGGRRGAQLLCLLTFAAPLLLTVESLSLLRRTHRVPVEYVRLIEVLRQRPAGNVLAGARLGNVLPAYTDHRVYVGHHFLTPRFRARQRDVIAWSTDPEQAQALLELVDTQQIRYAVLPSVLGAPGIEALSPRTRRRDEIGRYSLLELD